MTILKITFENGFEGECPLGKSRSSACMSCKHTDKVGVCYHPRDITTEIIEGKKAPARVEGGLWLPALGRSTDEVEMKNRTFYDKKTGEVVELIPLDKQVDERLKREAKKNAR
ncbi:MAG: hypothetical protein ABSC64_02370 [Candidatus Korobacteraceae bacterium]